MASNWQRYRRNHKVLWGMCTNTKQPMKGAHPSMGVAKQTMAKNPYWFRRTSIRKAVSHNCGCSFEVAWNFSNEQDNFNKNNRDPTNGICTKRPEQLVSDNGPQFTSTKFENFMSGKGITHFRSAPYHPTTNGLAKQLVRTFKQPESHEGWINIAEQENC